MNLSIWTENEIESITGYSVDTLRNPLFELSNFIRYRLTPDRLYSFDLESILKVGEMEET